MHKLGKAICKHRRLILIIALLLLIPSIIGMKSTKINYDILVYLPEEMRYNNHNPIQTSNTNGYEMQKEPRMQVEKIENKEDYIDLLLEADPSKDMIHKYLNDSDVYA